jgi:glycosyltransferase involved in cell wall biosynthesis
MKKMRVGEGKINSNYFGLRVHATNIQGLGASRLLASLLPELALKMDAQTSIFYLSAAGRESISGLLATPIQTQIHRRFLPNSLSRFLECMVFGYRFNGETPLLTLGDIPLRCNSYQIVFVQTPHLSVSVASSTKLSLKFRVLRWVFRKNLRFANKIIVQTEAMKDSLVESYPQIEERCVVICQPAPDWVLRSGLQRYGSLTAEQDQHLSLFYPSAGYPHKNHNMLRQLNADEVSTSFDIVLTLPEEQNPCPERSWVRCVGLLDEAEVLSQYSQTDALLFLSLEESLGLPLVEAMYLGLPIVCPDLPYARCLCGSGAIYFDPNSASSLLLALEELSRRRAQGLWPDWSDRLAKIPSSWDAVAGDFVNLFQAEQVKR